MLGATAVQRFGSGLNLHVHLHTLVLDGVFTGGSDDEPAQFHDEATWNSGEVATVLADLVHRLLRRGVIDFDAEVRAELDELVEKLAALVPRPRENLVIYFGVLAANARRRASIIRFGRPAPPSGSTTWRPSPDSRGRSSSPRDWATLVRRGLGIDLLECPRCGGRLRIRALLDDPRVAVPIAEGLGLKRERAGPRGRPSAAPAQEPRFEPDSEYVDHDEVS